MLFGETFVTCQQCGRFKWEDHRSLCFACSTAPPPRRLTLDEAIRLEDAPRWVREGSDDDRWFWLDGREVSRVG